MDHIHQVHGVDVSWTHRPTAVKEQPSQTATTSTSNPPINSVTTPSQSSTPQTQASFPLPIPAVNTSKTNLASHLAHSNSPLQSPPANDQASLSKTPPTPRKRDILTGRASQDSRTPPDRDPRSRRNSWISSLSSKFSSQPQPTPSAPQTSKSSANGVNAGPPQSTPQDHLPPVARPQENAKQETEELQPYIPQKPRESPASFFSSLSRRLSSGQSASSAKNLEKGSVCPRRILNVDHHRERCLVPELDLAKLRRVSFSVDVEIAGGPRYKDEPAASKPQKTKEKKIIERAEGEALKHPDVVKHQPDAVKPSTDVVTDGVAKNIAILDDKESDTPPGSGTDDKSSRTDEERKERRERRRRRAEEKGQLPVEVSGDDPTLPPAVTAAPSPPVSGAATPRSQDRPTTDPVRIYRRCCQLRESPILKRITEQLMAPNCTLPDDPGVVAELNLTGSRMQLADVFTLSDWLAIVPVKRLLLEDADLTDQGVRVILAGLLAAKKPEPTKRRNGLRLNRATNTGIIEKLTLKSNPKVTRVGWKYIALFLYMCRSIKALDVSMIQFPRVIPPTEPETQVKAPSGGMKTTGVNVDAAETLCKALSERLGGSHLEELTMAECGLSAGQIRKIVDGASISGLARLGLAGNNLDDEGFGHILHYVRSGVCQALDLGSNDLRDKLALLGEALTSRPDCPVWGLSLAGCNLTTDSLKELFPSLIALRDFRFLDLSHNANLFDGDTGALPLLRRTLPKLINLKRMHLRDVGLSAKQAISLAEVVPEAKSLAHLTILENPQLESLAIATDERSQEEACALYASLAAAARISQTIVCIDIDVPSPNHGEIIKALAKQVVAYCLRNMDRTMSQTLTGPLAASLSKPHGVEDARQVAMPDVLMHMVGDHDVNPSVKKDDGEVGPDEDYIVGGNGIIKALQYFLSEEAVDIRRRSTAASGTTTPLLSQVSAGQDVKQRGKAKEVSKELLDSARKLRSRLQPALVKEFASGDEIQLRRLSFLDDTLKRIIQRFEAEYPETRIVPASPLLPATPDPASLPSSLESSAADFGPLVSTPGDETHSTASSSSLFTHHQPFSPTTSALDSDDDDEEEASIHPAPRHSLSTLPQSRKNSDVSLASRALSLEEGRIHRLGTQVRRDLISSSSPSTDRPLDASAWAEGSRMSDMITRMTDTSGLELKEMLERAGWDGVLQNLGANLEELKQLQMRDPVGWEQFKESQVKAHANRRIGSREGGAVVE